MRLQELITKRKKDLGISYTQMVRKAEEAGFPVSRSMFHYYENKEWPTIPGTDAIKGLAVALDVDADEVLSAAGESVGIRPVEIRPDRGTRAIMGLLNDRTPEEIAALEAVIRSVTDALDKQSRDPKD